MIVEIQDLKQNHIYLFYLFMPQCFLWFYVCFWGEITRRFILDKIYNDKMILQNLWHDNERGLSLHKILPHYTNNM